MMNKRQTLALVQLCGILLLCDVQCKPTRRLTGQKLLPFLARACNRVSLGVYEEVATNNNNVVFSPISICTLLAVCVRGASDKTLVELRKSLFLELVDKREMSSVYGEVYRSFVQDPSVNISTTNIMIVNQNFQLVDRTVQDYQQTFNGTLLEFDPEMKSEVSTSINNMLSSATGGMVKGKLSADDITSDQALYLFNTLYMSARWRDQFTTSETRQQKFYLNATTHIMVPTMHKRGNYRWNKNSKLGFDMLELPYEGNRFAMYIILPREKDGLGRLEKVLTPERTLRLEKAITNMKKAAKTEVYLPKFSVSQSFSIKSALQKFGINLLFDEKKADLSALIKGGDVHVNQAFHDSAIDVTERGTVAGTYSKMGFYYLSSIPVFNANRPFMYVLRDTKTGFNVFMGRCIRP
ncbi:serine protease inhibitor 2.1-like [Haliotis rufescens]|uniref:serine protease inhibitor 2.1-like n=1 Tax=Haliotis rufescens TaxID=6454 RepID=UPI00201EC420|nr:serine protease inhibitor 2.1-like [Haliotis rufescens]